MEPETDINMESNMDKELATGKTAEGGELSEHASKVFQMQGVEIVGLIDRPEDYDSYTGG